jgi:hypothetical protein
VTAAEHIAARILLIGGVLGVALLMIGVVASTLWSDALRPRQPVSLHAIAHGLARRPPDPDAISGLALVVLFSTPVAAVAGAGLAFWRNGDLRFAVIAGLVVAAVLLSFWVGGV